MLSPTVVAALVAVASLPSAQALTPNCFFNVSFYDTSPLLHYNPPSAWYSQFVNTPANQWQPGMMGGGQSSHAAFGQGPNVTIEYIGTMAWAQGGHQNATATPIDFQIDGTQQPNAELNDVVWTSTSNQDIQMGTHTAVIQLNKAATDPNAILMLTLWQNRCGVSAQSSSADEVQCHQVEFAKDVQSKMFLYQEGNWMPYQTFGGQYGQPTIDYSSVIANGTAVIMLFPPKGSNYFSLNGTVGNAYGQYTVNVDPAPPYPRQINTFNASNSWAVPGEMLYYTPLDPEVTYKVTVTGDADGSKFLGLHDFTYCDYALPTSSVSGSIAGQTGVPVETPVPSPSPKKSSNVGAIAGGVVGGVGGAALIAGLLFFFCRRKRSKKDGLDADPAMFTIDDTVDATTPYHPPPQGGVAKLAQDQNRYVEYASGPQYGQQLYQEPNMAEVPYGFNPAAGPLLTPDSQSRQGSGPFGDRQSSGNWGSEGSYPHSGTDHRQSLGAASGYMSMSSGTNEKSIPAHQQRHQSRVEIEQDAGGLPMPAEDVEKLPPTYNPHWLDARTSLSDAPAGPSAGPGPSSSSEMPPGAAPAAMHMADHKGQVPSATEAYHMPHDPSAQGGAPFVPPKEK